jgi:hypothetical protein
VAKTFKNDFQVIAPMEFVVNAAIFETIVQVQHVGKLFLASLHFNQTVPA